MNKMDKIIFELLWADGWNSSVRMRCRNYDDQYVLSFTGAVTSYGISNALKYGIIVSVVPDNDGNLYAYAFFKFPKRATVMRKFRNFISNYVYNILEVECCESIGNQS